MPYFSYTQIHLGPITLYTWGFFVALAFLAGYGYFFKQAKKEGIAEKNIFWLGLTIFFGALAGSRLAYVAQFPARYFSSPLEIFGFAAGGLVFYGGLLGGLFFGWLYVKKNKLGFLKTADILAPAIALGIFVGRIGCWLINDHQGAPAGLPWAITWPDGISRHPVALYLSLNGLVLFLMLLFLKNKLKKPGQLALVFLGYDALSRFFLDFTRAGDTSLSDPRYLNLTISQWVGLVALTALLFYFKKKR